MFKLTDRPTRVRRCSCFISGILRFTVLEGDFVRGDYVLDSFQFVSEGQLGLARGRGRGGGGLASNDRRV